MIVLFTIIVLGIGGNIIVWTAVMRRAGHGYTPLVDPVPDAFPLHYRSPYIPLDRELIDGYQPRLDPNRSLLQPPQSHSVICQCDTCMGMTATVKDAPHEASSWEMSL